MNYIDIYMYVYVYICVSVCSLHGYGICIFNIYVYRQLQHDMS